MSLGFFEFSPSKEVQTFLCLAVLKLSVMVKILMLESAEEFNCRSADVCVYVFLLFVSPKLFSAFNNFLALYFVCYGLNNKGAHLGGVSLGQNILFQPFLGWLLMDSINLSRT